MFFPKRRREPEQMLQVEDKAFAVAALENYDIWFQDLAKDIVKRSRVTSGTIVDVACGPGLLSKALGQYKRLKIIGIDISKQAVAIARKNCRDEANVSIQKGSAYELPFADASVDGLVCRDSFHHFVYPKKVLREMLRVVRPGGFIYIQDLRRDLPVRLLKQALPRKTIFQKLQYYSARAAYTKTEVKVLLKQCHFPKAHIATRSSDNIKNERHKNSLSAHFYVFVRV